MALLDPLTLFALRSLRNLSSPTACRLGGALGVLAWRLGIRRKLVNRTMERALGVRGPARARYARQAYATMGANFLEIWTAGGCDGIERHAVPTDAEWMRAVQRRHPGLVLATLHLGSWDGAIIGGMGCFARVMAYAKAQHHPAVDGLLNECRQITGAEVLLTRQGDRSGAVQVMRLLRGGLGAVGLLADQRPRSDEANPARFLGIPAWCHPGPAFFAKRANVWIAPAFALRASSDRTNVYVLRPFRVDHLDEAAATQLVMDKLSALIAAFPGQYFWHHRRFTDEPAGLPADDARWRTGLEFLR